MTTPKVILLAAEGCVILGIVLGFCGAKFHRRIFTVIGACACVLGIIVVLACPICISCNGQLPGGSKWEGVCCSRAWAFSRRTPWWDLIMEPAQWK